MRSGELRTLRRRDLDLAAGRAVVVGKGARQRIVLLPPALVPTLSEFLAEVRPRLPDSPLLLANAHPFVTTPQHGFGTDALAREVELAGLGARVPGRHYPHKWRHTYATELVRAGVDIHVVQRLLGHDHHRLDGRLPAPRAGRPALRGRRYSGTPREPATRVADPALAFAAQRRSARSSASDDAKFRCGGGDADDGDARRRPDGRGRGVHRPPGPFHADPPRARGTARARECAAAGAARRHRPHRRSPQPGTAKAESCCWSTPRSGSTICTRRSRCWSTRCTPRRCTSTRWCSGSSRSAPSPTATGSCGCWPICRSPRVASHAEVLHLVESRRLYGRGLALVDAHLLAATLLTPGVRLWTRDRALRPPRKSSTSLPRRGLSPPTPPPRAAPPAEPCQRDRRRLSGKAGSPGPPKRTGAPVLQCYRSSGVDQADGVPVPPVVPQRPPWSQASGVGDGTVVDRAQSGRPIAPR